MQTNVEVTKKKNESNASVLKRFGRKVSDAGLLQAARKNRFASRNESDYTKKKNKLKSLEKREKIEGLIKLGKIAPRGRGRK